MIEELARESYELLKQWIVTQGSKNIRANNPLYNSIRATIREDSSFLNPSQVKYLKSVLVANHNHLKPAQIEEYSLIYDVRYGGK